MIFDRYLRDWNLTPDGPAIHTHSSDLLSVRYEGRAAMLKIARAEEERVGSALMARWNGAGAAHVWQHDAGAALLERVEGDLNLNAMVRAGQDDEATRILCRAVGRLHGSGTPPWPGVPVLERWFRPLEETAPRVGGVMALALDTVQTLFRKPRDLRVLHGDIHHGNVLHSHERGWLAIDPKGIVGERGYDYANIFCNPTLAWAATPGRLARQSYVVAQEAGLERKRLLGWIVAYAGLSAAWHVQAGEREQADATFKIAQTAAAELNG